MMARYWRQLSLIGLAVVSLDMLLLLELPSPHWFIDGLILLVTGFTSFWFVSRMQLAWRHWQTSGGETVTEVPEESGEIVRLHVQEQALSALENMLMPARSKDGRLVSLKAPWGAGKTLLLRRLQERLNGSDAFIPVWINVWATETEADLHRAFYEKILHTPAVFRECWLALPWLTPRLSLLLRRMVHSVRIAFRNGGIEAEATLQADLPLALTVQAQIDWIVRRLRRQDKALVVVLEEIDRTTPTIAKLSITAAQRSLILPGVTIVLPYVQEHLWNKVFNPLDPAPADLDATIESLLYQDMEYATHIKPMRRSNQGEVEEVPLPEHLGLYAAKPLPRAEERVARPLDARAPLAVWQRYRLHSYFAVLPPTHQKRLQRRFAEKYLGGYQVEMQAYGAKDIATLVTEKTSLFRIAQCAFPALAIAEEAEAKAAMREAVERYCTSLKVEHLRHFEHFYLRLLVRDVGQIAAPPGTEGLNSQLKTLLKQLGMALDSPEARQLIGKLQPTAPDWPLKCAARAVAALVALAAWFAARMMEDEES